MSAGYIFKMTQNRDTIAKEVTQVRPTKEYIRTLDTNYTVE